MNKSAKALLDKCIKLEMDKKLPLFKGIYIIQRRELHDSGYRMMYVIGHTEYDREKQEREYYLIGTYSDVVDFQPVWDKYIKGSTEMCDLHLDIDRNGIIHIWTNSNKRFNCYCPYVSSCTLEVM